MANKPTIKDIDAVLPQTQCQLCTYEGCLPYATAIVENQERIDRCPPGGIEGLEKLAGLTQQSAEPFKANMQTKADRVAVIREDECIGCTKCIQACPVDAIMGASKQMHVVLTDECSGCELCIAPCPVDCIDMKLISPHNNPEQRSAQYRTRYENRNHRLANKAQKAAQKRQQKLIGDSKTRLSNAEKLRAIKAAIQRKSSS